MKKAILIIVTILTGFQVWSQQLPSGLNEKDIVWLGAYNLNMSNGDRIYQWDDKSGQDHDAYQYTSNRRASYLKGGEGSINDQPSVYFDGVRDYFQVSNNNEINNQGPYTEKTFVLVFRTSDDISSTQVIYEEGANVRGMNLYIYHGTLYAGLWNLYNDKPGAYFNFVSLDTVIEPNTNYYAEVVFDSTHDQFSFSLNGVNIGTVNNIGALYRHTGNISIGGTVEQTVTHKGVKKNAFFKGAIGEFLYFNSALSDDDLDMLADAIGPRWGFDHTGVLPVEMLEYSAHMENNSTIINWSTVSELNNEYFTIERSDDMQNWIEIGTVYGSGNSSTRVNYEFVDYLPVNGTVYYRLSQTDFDGTTEIFNPFSVNSDNEGSGLSIENSYSNGSELRVEFSSETTDPVTIKIFSISGVVLAETTVNPVPGYNSVSLDVNASGIGIMKLSQRGEFQSEKTLLN